MIPSLITNLLATARRSRAILISFNLTFVDEVIVLFTPQHSGKSLTLNIPHVIREGEIGKSPIERIGLRFPLGNHIINKNWSSRIQLHPGLETLLRMWTTTRPGVAEDGLRIM